MNRLALTFFLIFFLAEAMGQQDSGFERRMYDIYQQSYSQEVQDDQWAAFLQNIGNRIYEVREGDTLWDLSVIFFGDGLYWSKIWSYNERLTNPHLLYVGQEIQFYAGSVEIAPGVNVDPDATEEGAVQTEGENAEIEAVEGLPEGFKEVKEEFVEVTEAPTEKLPLEVPTEKGVEKPKAPLKVLKLKSNRGLYPGAPKIPPPRRLVRPVLENLPSAFEDSLPYDANQYNEKGLSFDIRPPVRVNPLFIAHSFLYGRDADRYPRVGKLVEAENKEELVGLNQKVYIRSEQPLERGERLTVMGRQYDFDRNGYVGDVIQYQGTVEINGKVQKDIFQATVIKSLSGIKGSPWVSREEIPSFNDDYVGRPNASKLQLIGGGQDNVTRVFGQSDVVFIGGGTNKGVRVGDILGIYKRRDIRYSNYTVKRAPEPIGHIKVFRAEQDTASAFVISSNEVIVPGDETGPPTIVEAQTTESEKEDLNDIEGGLDFETN